MPYGNYKKETADNQRKENKQNDRKKTKTKKSRNSANPHLLLDDKENLEDEIGKAEERGVGEAGRKMCKTAAAKQEYGVENASTPCKNNLSLVNPLLSPGGGNG